MFRPLYLRLSKISELLFCLFWTLHEVTILWASRKTMGSPCYGTVTCFNQGPDQQPSFIWQQQAKNKRSFFPLNPKTYTVVSLFVGLGFRV